MSKTKASIDKIRYQCSLCIILPKKIFWILRWDLNPYVSVSATGFVLQRCVLCSLTSLRTSRLCKTRGGQAQRCCPCCSALQIPATMQIKNDTLRCVVLYLVGATGFEPTAFWSRTKRATKLRYAPNGAKEGTRTLDPRITNALLYQLSHIGTKRIIT